MAGVIRGRNPLILAVHDAPQLCCGVVHEKLPPDAPPLAGGEDVT